MENFSTVDKESDFDGLDGSEDFSGGSDGKKSVGSAEN